MGLCASRERSKTPSPKPNYQNHYVQTYSFVNRCNQIYEREAKTYVPSKKDPYGTRYLRVIRPGFPEMPKLGDLEINPWTVLPRESYRIVLGQNSDSEKCCPDALLIAENENCQSGKYNSSLLTVSKLENDAFYPDIRERKSSNSDKSITNKEESPEYWLNLRIKKILAAEELGKAEEITFPPTRDAPKNEQIIQTESVVINDLDAKFSNKMQRIIETQKRHTFSHQA